MFMGILRGIGRPHEVKRIEKRTRDEVLCKYNTALQLYFPRETLQQSMIPSDATQRGLFRSSFQNFMVKGRH